MVRWRYFLVVALLLLLPVKTGSKLEEEEEDENLNIGGPEPAPDTEKRADESEEDDDDDDDDDDDETSDKSEQASSKRKLPPPPVVVTKAVVTTAFSLVTKAEKKRPLECYVCAYKSETPMRSCLDPTKFRVHTLTCHSTDDKCFTSIISKHSAYEAVVRGCRSNCVGTPDTTCCELNRCNNQALAMPTPVPKALMGAESDSSAVEKSLQPNVLFFVTILLLLQTVVRVVIV